MAHPSRLDQLTNELERRLTEHYGPLLASRDLWKVLGYRSPAAFRQARLRQSLPVTEFQIDGRRGRFALTRDIAHWLAKQRLQLSDEENGN